MVEPPSIGGLPSTSGKKWYCPRDCHKGRTYATLEAVKKHVALQHPDHDPLWFETAPE